LSKAMLIDITRCIGCRSCQVSCKSWNNLDTEKTSFSNSITNPPATAAQTFTMVDFIETEQHGKPAWRFVKRMCMHCIDPACVSACFAKAITKSESGAVVYNKKNCVGCRYCMLACPWWIPKYEWDKVFPAVKKCRLCIDLLEEGRKPACATSCPSAIEFGDREEMLALARKRISTNPGKYIDHIYGEHEAGGTSVLYLSDVPFENLGFSTKISYEPYPKLTWKALKKVPALAVGVGASMTAIYMLTHRKEQVLKAEQDKIEKVGE